MGLLLILTALCLPGREIVVKLAVKPGQKTVDPTLLPLVCITVGLDYAELAVTEFSVVNLDTKDIWIAKVGSLIPTRPKVITAMKGQHRLLAMMVFHLKPGRYQLRQVEFEGSGQSLFVCNLNETKSISFNVAPDRVNYVGSFILQSEWNLFLARGPGKIPASITVEPTAERDAKWVTRVVPGIACLASVHSALEIVEPPPAPGL
jgi:hypothetical protein